MSLLDSEKGIHYEKVISSVLNANLIENDLLVKQLPLKFSSELCSKNNLHSSDSIAAYFAENWQSFKSNLTDRICITQ